MSQSYTSPDFGTLYIPGAAAVYKVQNTDSTIASNGIVILIGEATSGLDYANEEVLEDNFFGPDQLGDVLAKYKSGPLVDAYAGIIAPANDPDITGTVNSVYLIKTNASGRASKAIVDPNSVAYGTLFDRSYGQLGNLIYFKIAETAEVKPTTGSFTYIPPVASNPQTFRVNGGAAVTASVTAAMPPNTYVSTVDALAGVAATGGANRAMISVVAGTLTVVASGNQITLTISTAWSTTPTVGDTLIIPSGSVIQGGSNQNIGAYVVTASTSSTVTAIKLSDYNKPSAVAGVITAPVNIGPLSIVSTSADAVAYAPVTITLEGSTIINGIAKTLEVNQATMTEKMAYLLGTTTAVSWVGTSGSPKIINSATERSVTTTVSRQADSVSDSFTAGGSIALLIGYTGTTGSVQVTSTQMIFTVTGGSGLNMTLTLKNFSTLSDLATYISSQTGYTASVGTAAIGQKSPLALDEGTYGCGTTYGGQTCQIKIDAVSFYEAVRDNSSLVVFSDDETPAASGLPGTVSTNTYLSGGTLGATTDAIYQSALTACEQLTANFVVPLFSRDATADIADALTDSSSTYTIDAINTATLAHCVAMSKPKKRRNRQSFLSKRTSFTNAKTAAANLASSRATMSFQDAKALGTAGISQFQPWMLAVKAAGTQASAFYKAIFNKVLNITGVVTADTTYDPNNDTQTETALQSGLLVARKSKSGGYRIVSDQTTYLKDNNFLYNSVQAQYAADLVAVTLAERMENAYVGQSLADVTAAQAAATIQAIMADLKAVKLIASSDGFPAGYKNVVVRISGPVMSVTCDVFLATALYFIPITFNVSEIKQVASL